MSSYFADRIPVTVLTGFLGSGKTTLLNRLLESGRMDNTLVLINEYGEVAIDHLIAQQLTDDVVLLESGCVCCTLRGEFQVTLLDLCAQRDAEVIPPFDHIVLETTGLADPGPVLQILMTDTLVMEDYVFQGLVCVVDGALGERTLGRHEVSIKQVAMADLLVISKEDLATPEAISALRRTLASLNPGARMVAGSAIGVPEDLFAEAATGPAERSGGPLLLQAAPTCGHGAGCAGEHHHDHDHDHDHHREHDAGISSFTVYPGPGFDEAALQDALDDAVLDSGDRILRIKGILRVRDRAQPLLVHGVQNIFHPFVELDGWPDTDERNRLVFIGHELDEELIAAKFLNS